MTIPQLIREGLLSYLARPELNISVDGNIESMFIEIKVLKYNNWLRLV